MHSHMHCKMDICTDVPHRPSAPHRSPATLRPPAPHRPPCQGHGGP
jgi:hypothetical protein